MEDIMKSLCCGLGATAPKIEDSKMEASKIKNRFDRKEASSKYCRLTGTGVDKREKRIVKRLLETVDGDIVARSILDMPCGTGRMFPFLSDLGFDVYSADSSPFMVEQAKENLAALGMRVNPAKFAVADAFKTDFDDGQFDIVLCNRLLHHFSSPESRQAILKELRRIAKHFVIVSFFHNASWDAMTFWMKHFFRGTAPTDRIPQKLTTLKQDIDAAGLELIEVKHPRKFISKQCYLLLRPKRNT